MHRRMLSLTAALVAALALGWAGAGDTHVDPPPAGTIETHSFFSAALGKEIAYNVYLPGGYADSGERYPVIYLLHGRGDDMSAWTRVAPMLDELIAQGAVPPLIAVMPDAPSSNRASYYVDSAYTGAESPGEKVETAFIGDLLPHVDATYRTVAERSGRAIGGYSMGGYGALRYALAYPELFGAAIVLSPAVYVPLPPADSSTREFGAFGSGSELFVDAIYQAKNYPTLLPSFEATGLPLRMFIAVGDDEYHNPDPADAEHDLDFEAHRLYNKVVRVDTIASELRVVDGGHDWDVWEPAFAEGLKNIAPLLIPPAPPMGGRLSGTPQEERAGGVAFDAQGNLYEAFAAEGPIDGQGYAGAKDIVLVKYAPDGQRLWTRAFGTATTERAYGVAVDQAGNAYVVGYTRGDLDGQHPANANDDLFVAKYAPSGDQAWVRQLGDPAAADRGYGVAAGEDGGIYVAGYTRGALAGANAGDKDVILVKFLADGTSAWARQFGTTAEDKALAIAADARGRIYLAGMTAGALQTSAGGSDGFLARFSPAGEQSWVTQFGTAGGEEATGLTAAASGEVYVTGLTAGDFAGTLVGDKDIFAARFSAKGKLTWKDQIGTPANDKGADIRRDSAGNTYVVGFSDGRLGDQAGRFDIVLITYGKKLNREDVRQFGTRGDDGADDFAEENLFMDIHGSQLAIGGLTTGDLAGQPALGSGDVFLVRIDLDK